jgi:hypothetical protein
METRWRGSERKEGRMSQMAVMAKTTDNKREWREMRREEERRRRDEMRIEEKRS